MTTSELIRALRELPGRSVCIPNDTEAILNEAADRLEMLDERVAIMAASMDEAWGNSFE